MNEFAGNSTIVFSDTQNECQRLALVLRKLGFEAICIHGGMTQPKRLGALHKFKGKERNILIATDVAARGLDIPSVDLVVNYDIPMHGKVRSQSAYMLTSMEFNGGLSVARFALAGLCP